MKLAKEVYDAEGNGRSGNKDYAHFLAIARGGLYATISQLELAKELGYIDDYDSVIPLAEEVSRMLTSMLKKYGALEMKTNDHCPPLPLFST